MSRRRAEKDTQAIAAELERARRIEMDLNFQIETMQSELSKRNEKLDGELLEGTALLEGSIFAVRRLTHELVRTLDEAAAAVSPGSTVSRRS